MATGDLKARALLSAAIWFDGYTKATWLELKTGEGKLTCPPWQHTNALEGKVHDRQRLLGAR